MKPLDPNAYLTLHELCVEVNELRKGLDQIAETEALTGRTVRFYVEKQLLPSVRSGPGKKYPYDTVWKILFVRLLQFQHQIQLNQIAHVLQEVDVETMRRVVTGEEPIELRSAPDLDSVRRHLEQGYQVVGLPQVAEAVHENEPSWRDDKGWQTLLKTPDVQISVRDGLPVAKVKQLQQVAGLVQSILNEVVEDTSTKTIPDHHSTRRPED